MRGAPPVQMACGRDARWHATVGLLCAGAAAVAAGWAAAQLGATGWVTMLCAAAAAGLGAIASAWLADRHAGSRLTWDGQAWALDGQAGDLGLMIDLGAWVLLRFNAHDGSPPHWLPLSLARADAPIHLCRAALHAHAGRRTGLLDADG